jgi:hypothetical protein
MPLIGRVRGDPDADVDTGVLRGEAIELRADQRPFLTERAAREGEMSTGCT